MGIYADENLTENTIDELREEDRKLSLLCSMLAVSVMYACEGRDKNYADISDHLQTKQLVFEGEPGDDWLETRGEDPEGTLGDLLGEIAQVGFNENDEPDAEAYEQASEIMHDLIERCHNLQNVLEPGDLYLLLFGAAMCYLGVGGDGLTGDEVVEEQDDGDDADDGDDNGAGFRPE